MTSVPRLQRGLSMIELMVGVTIALFLTAGAAHCSSVSSARVGRCCSKRA